MIDRADSRFFEGATSFAVTATFMIVFIGTPCKRAMELAGSFCFSTAIFNAAEVTMRLILAQVAFP